MALAFWRSREKKKKKVEAEILIDVSARAIKKGRAVAMGLVYADTQDQKGNVGHVPAEIDLSTENKAAR